MKCVVCDEPEVPRGTVTVTLERGTTTVVVKGVPARVCANCGEEYVDEQTTADLMKTAEDAVEAGVQVDVRKYLAA